MKPEKEIIEKNSKLNAEIKTKEARLSRRKRITLITATLVYAVCAIGYYFSFINENYLIAFYLTAVACAASCAAPCAVIVGSGGVDGNIEVDGGDLVATFVAIGFFATATTIAADNADAAGILDINATISIGVVAGVVAGVVIYKKALQPLVLEIETLKSELGLAGTPSRLDEQSEDVDLLDVVNERFSAGEGVLLLNLDMPDELISLSVKQALAASKGRSFRVVSC